MARITTLSLTATPGKAYSFTPEVVPEVESQSGYESLSSVVLPPFVSVDKAESTMAAVLPSMVLSDKAETLMQSVLPSFASGDQAELLSASVLTPFAASDQGESQMEAVLPSFAAGDAAESLCKSVFETMGVNAKMLGEATGTLIWHFTSGATRVVIGSFQSRNPNLEETNMSREERFDATLDMPYDDVNGVSEPDRDDWVEVRGESWDVLTVGIKQGGFRHIELIRSNRLHETAGSIFARLS